MLSYRSAEDSENNSAQTRIAAASAPPVQQRVQVVLAPHLDLDAPIPATDQLLRQWHQAFFGIDCGPT